MRISKEALWTLMVGMVVVVATTSAGDDGCIDLVVSNMMGCVAYMKAEEGLPPPPPGKACCDGLSVVVKTDPHCLCVAIAAAPSFGVTINMTRADALPALCRLADAPFQCVVPIPVPDPTPTPAPEPHQESTIIAPAPAAGSSTTVSPSSALVMAIVAAIIV